LKEERWHRFMAAQQEISRELLAEKTGRLIDVLIDEVDEEGAIGRSVWDAPEIDGSVFLNGETGLAPGDIVKARVVHADDYDLWAEAERAEH
jgi:ribosomal protein S12 methylthiotransferase